MVVRDDGTSIIYSILRIQSSGNADNAWPHNAL